MARIEHLIVNYVSSSTICSLGCAADPTASGRCQKNHWLSCSWTTKLSNQVSSSMTWWRQKREKISKFSVESFSSKTKRSRGRAVGAASAVVVWFYLVAAGASIGVYFYSNFLLLVIIFFFLRGGAMVKWRTVFSLDSRGLLWHFSEKKKKLRVQSSTFSWCVELFQSLNRRRIPRFVWMNWLFLAGN